MSIQPHLLIYCCDAHKAVKVCQPCWIYPCFKCIFTKNGISE